MAKTLKTPATVVESAVESTGITKEQFLQYTKGRDFISRPEKRMLKVRSVNQWINPSGQTVAILNFNAVTPYHMNLIKEFIKAGDLQAASNEVLTATVRVGIDYVPTKGEYVNVMITAGKTKAGDDALFAGSITPVPVAASVTVDFSSMFE